MPRPLPEIPTLADAFRQSSAGEHYCLIVEAPEEQLGVTGLFFAAGRARDERCIYVAEIARRDKVLAAFRELGFESDLQRRAVEVLTQEEVYLRNGRFDPEAMLSLIDRRIVDARADGFTGFRVSGEMTWILSGKPGCDRAIEYASRLNGYLQRTGASALCQYPRSRFSAEMLMDVLRTHPMVIFRGRVCRNPHYVPTEDFLDPGHAERDLSRLLLELHQREVVERELLFHSQLFERVNDAVIATDEHLRLTAWNQAAERLYGWPFSEVVGKPASDVLGSQFAGMTRRDAENLIESETGVELRLLQHNRRGDELFVESRGHVLKDVAGHISGYVWVNRDITERIRQERERERDRMLLRERVKELECIHRIGWILQSTEPSLEETLRQVVELVPTACQHSDVAGCRLTCGELEFASSRFQQSPWRVTIPLQTDDGNTGVLEIAYVERRPDEAVGPFFQEELTLFRSVVELIQIYLNRKVAERRTRQQLERIVALRTIDRSITSVLDRDLVFGVVLEQTMQQLGVDAASILLLDPVSQRLKVAGVRGFHSPGIVRRVTLRLGEGFAGKAALERCTVAHPALRENSPDGPAPLQLGPDTFRAYAAAPLLARARVKGVLEVFHRTELKPDDDWYSFLETLAGQAAIAIEDFELFDGLQRSNTELELAYERTLEGWVAALDLRDKETEGHTQRVTQMTVRLAQAFSLGEAQLVQIRRGALLHDVGKLGIPDSILFKPDKLTPDEWEVMKKHPVYAHDWLSEIEYLRPALEIPYCHHEKWDGTGYPRGLKGTEIPLSARIFAAIDIWDALVSDRPYRPAMPRQQVREHIASLAGTHLDPEVVKVFLARVDALTAVDDG